MLQHAPLAVPDSQPKARDVRRWWREPLLHFLVLGGLAFLVHHLWFGGTAPRHVLTEDAPLEQIRADWFAARGEPPSAAQEATLVQEWVEEEVLYRRALELGLDQNDTIVRRRLVQRMRFLLEDTSRLEAPSEAELRAWLQERSQKFALPAKITFTHVFFSRGRRGSSLGASAAAALDLLKRDPEAQVDGDPFFRGNAFEDATPMEIQGAFGPEFAESMAGVPPGQWIGPFKSSYGLHLVYVDHRVPGTTPGLDAVREKVERDWLQAERARRNEESIAKLRARYAPEGPR